VQGAQVSRRLIDAGSYEVLCVESGAGVERLRERGIDAVPLAEAGQRADAAILAVPDEVIGPVAREVVPALKSGSMAVVLDAAAAYADPGLVDRDDVGFVIVHPNHPSLFSAQLTPEGRRDYAGGAVGVPQDALCCLAHGAEEHYATGEALARDMFAPVDEVHRVTLEQFIVLEPTLTETTVAMLLTTVKEAMDEAIARGVPEKVARSFMYGHVGIELAIIFGELDAKFSTSAYLAIDEGREMILRPEWKQVFEPEQVRRIAEAIARPGD
jgi:hypothetical protein